MAMEDDEIPLPRGGYNIDFDNLDDNFNPFATKSNVVTNFDENAPLTVSTKSNVQNSNENISNLPTEPIKQIITAESPTKLVSTPESPKNGEKFSNNTSLSPDENKNPNSNDKQAAMLARMAKRNAMRQEKAKKATEDRKKKDAKRKEMIDKVKRERAEKLAAERENEKVESEEDKPLPKGGYKIDFDNLDPNFDPFATKQPSQPNFSTSNTTPTQSLQEPTTPTPQNPQENNQKSESFKDKLERSRKNRPENDTKIETKSKPRNKPTPLSEKIAEMRRKKLICEKVDNFAGGDNNLRLPDNIQNPSDINLPDSNSDRHPSSNLDGNVENCESKILETKLVEAIEDMSINTPTGVCNLQNEGGTFSINKTIEAGHSDSLSLIKIDDYEDVTCDSPAAFFPPPPSSFNRQKSTKPSSSIRTQTSVQSKQFSLNSSTKPILEMVSNSVQRDASIYNEVLKRHAKASELSMKDAQDRADIEEEYTRVRNRYEKIRNSQSNSYLNQVQHQVKEQSKNIKDTCMDNVQQFKQLKIAFEEFKKEHRKHILHLEHELTVFSGKCKMNEKTITFQNRKIDTLVSQNQTLQAEVDFEKQKNEELVIKSTDLEKANAVLKNQNDELENMVEELLPPE